MIGKYFDGTEQEVCGFNEADCINKLNDVTNHGKLISWNYKNDQDYVDGEYVGEENFDNYIEEIDSCSSVMGANYGGAYDIDPESYFTRDNLNEFAECVTDKLEARFGRPFDVISIYVSEDYKGIELSVQDSLDENEYETQFRFDFRKIKKPSDLISKYCDDVVMKLSDSIEEFEGSIDEVDIVSSTSTNSCAERLESDIFNKVRNWLSTMALDIDPDMFYVDIADTSDGRLRVEVRAELSYTGMMHLANLLDPVVQKYDRDAYFDQEEPGIMTAYVECNNSVNGSIDIDDNGNVRTEDDIVISLKDAPVTVHEDGSYEFTDEVGMLDPDEREVTRDDGFGYWISNDRDHLRIADSEGIIYYLDNLLESYLPSAEGDYLISCKCTIHVEVTGIVEDKYTDSIYTDDMDVYMDPDQSYVEDFKVIPA